jgi:hypothetical protein
MFRYLLPPLKILASVVIAACIFGLEFDSAFFPHPFTIGLSVLASLVLFFGKTSSARIQSWSFLLLVLVIPMGIPWYLFYGTIKHGWPWPYAVAPGDAEFFSSYAAAEQVRMVGLVALLAVAAVMLGRAALKYARSRGTKAAR